MELMMRIMAWISAKMLILLKPYFWYRNRVKPARILPTMNPLFNLTACGLAKKIRNGQVSSEAVVKAYIERIREVNPILNAVVEDRFSAALRDARHCDKMLEAGVVTPKQLELEKPFYGVPFTVKESCGLKGLSQTGGSIARRGIKASQDSLLVVKMREAGAIPLCVTNTPEMCSGMETTNPLFGATLNPYNGRHTVGGSSGGEAALLAAGASVLGLGSDLAGSIRMPSLFNGIFGHKFTSQTVSLEGHLPSVEGTEYAKYVSCGPMARYAEDLHMAAKVMSRDCKKNLRLDEPVNISKLNVYYLEDIEKNYGIPSVDEDIKQSIRLAVKYFESCGAKTNKPVIEEMRIMCEIILSKLFAQDFVLPILLHPSDPNIIKNPILELIKAVFGCSPHFKTHLWEALIAYLNAFIRKSKFPLYEDKYQVLKKKLLKILDGNSVLLFPTFISPAPLIGEGFLVLAGASFSIFASMFGLPATHVPMGINEDGLPIGFQVIAGPHQDRLCLAVAKELEKAFGGWVSPTEVRSASDCLKNLFD